jgi:hypothetical protein
MLSCLLSRRNWQTQRTQNPPGSALGVRFPLPSPFNHWTLCLSPGSFGGLRLWKKGRCDNAGALQHFDNCALHWREGHCRQIVVPEHAELRLPKACRAAGRSFLDRKLFDVSSSLKGKHGICVMICLSYFRHPCRHRALSFNTVRVKMRGAKDLSQTARIAALVITCALLLIALPR